MLLADFFTTKALVPYLILLNIVASNALSISVFLKFLLHTSQSLSAMTAKIRGNITRKFWEVAYSCGMLD